MRSLPWCGLGVLLAISMPTRVEAEDQAPSAGDVALARSLGLEGVQLAEAGNCALAIDKFQRAEALYHAPTILVRLGECQIATGKIVAGTETLQRVVREPLGPKAPKAFADAQVRAQKSLDAALPKLAKLRIHVEGPPGVRPSVKLDGESVSTAALDVDRPADPGYHQIEVSAQGFKTAKSDTTLTEGGSASATLRLEPDGTPGAPPAMAQYPPAHEGGPGAQTPQSYGAQTNVAPAPEQKGSSKGLGIVLMGVGGAGVVVGSIFGGVALSRRSSLDEACNPKSNCSPTAQGDIDAMNTAATVSTVGFAVGGAALVAGLIVFLTSRPAAAAETRAASSKPFIAPFVGQSSMGVQGSF